MRRLDPRSTRRASASPRSSDCRGVPDVSSTCATIPAASCAVTYRRHFLSASSSIEGDLAARAAGVEGAAFARSRPRCGPRPPARACRSRCRRPRARGRPALPLAHRAGVRADLASRRRAVIPRPGASARWRTSSKSWPRRPRARFLRSTSASSSSLARRLDAVGMEQSDRRSIACAATSLGLRMLKVSRAQRRGPPSTCLDDGQLAYAVEGRDAGSPAGGPAESISRATEVLYGSDTRRTRSTEAEALRTLGKSRPRRRSLSSCFSLLEHLGDPKLGRHRRGTSTRQISPEASR
jgi:hypothetical protein